MPELQKGYCRDVPCDYRNRATFQAVHVPTQVMEAAPGCLLRTQVPEDVDGRQYPGGLQV